MEMGDWNVLNEVENIMEDKRMCVHVRQLILAGNNEMQQSLKLEKKISDQFNMTVRRDCLDKSETAD